MANTSADATGQTWGFGDGNTSNAVAPVHSYLNPGNYVVDIIVSNPVGCLDTASTVLTVFAPVTADFTAPNVCIGNRLNF